jgi:tRNA(Ile)-lysidine synthetase-like protein
VIAFFLFVVRYWTSGTKSNSDEDRNRLNCLWDYFVNTGPGSAMVDRIQNSQFSVRSILTALLPSSTGASNTNTSSNTGSNTGSSTDKNCRQEIRNNRTAIQSVLEYWFGQYAPEKSQKMLWMIAASSKEHLEKIDTEIASRFKGLLRDLSSSSDDGKNPSSIRWEQWCLDPDGIYGAHGKIAAIIVLDQFSRHILRHYENKNNNLLQQKQPLPTKESLDQMALATAELLVKDHQAELDCGMVPLPMRVFALMPYRHASTMESVRYVQQIVEVMAALEEQNEAMVGRFRKATNRRLAVLQDDQRRMGTAGGNDKGNDNDNGNDKGKDNQDGAPASTGNEAQKLFSDDDILETFPFEADMTPALEHPIHKTIVQFLADQGIHSSNTSRGKAKKGDAPMAPSPSSPKKAGIIVSLSGGVDSMAIACVLAHLKASCGYDHLTILAVHIDYANRPESEAEADYVRRYCEDILDTGSIEFTCRRIDEVTRGITARDDYERIAREIRYTSYREAVARAKDAMGLVSKVDRNQTIVGVMLGHHRGDLRENVLSNAHKGCGPLDLSGMTAVSKNDGITLYRPLLPLEKSFVFDYAHKFGVPYYKDTTPHWSTRGKLRNKLIPLLEEIYGDGSMNNLSNLAVESDECRALMNKSMIEPFLKTVVHKPMGIVFDTASWKDQPLFFWKVVLREALHSVGLGMFSDKSVVAFLERIRAQKIKAAWLQCRKDYGVYLQLDGRILVLYPSSFPWSKKDAYGLDGQGKFCLWCSPKTLRHRPRSNIPRALFASSRL